MHGQGRGTAGWAKLKVSIWGSLAQGWAPKWSVAEMPQGVEFGVERGPDVRLGPEDAGQGAHGGEVMA